MARTQVAIIGAGPAGLILGHLLHLYGIDSVIIESRSRKHVIDRVRAGVLEPQTVDLLIATGVGERLKQQGLRHDGVYIAFGGVRRHINFKEMIGKSITVYGQNEIVKDLIDARIATGRPLHFEAKDVSVHDFDGPSPKVRFRKDGEEHLLHCDFIAGCDGFHGICRPSIQGALTAFEKVHPFAWLGILAHAAPSSDELVYALHERGFALFSMRTTRITRLYLQCAPDEDVAEWPDDRIWSELNARLRTTDGWKPNEGRIFQKGITPMRSFIADPMRCGRLFLAGDSAHIVPPTGAKGLNLAAADVRILANALWRFYASSDQQALDEYSATCLRRVRKAQRFSWWMTSMLHLAGEGDAFDYRQQLAELDYITSSRTGMTTLAENYVGLRIDVPLPQRESFLPRKFPSASQAHLIVT